jgi:hypothetical protein
MILVLSFALFTNLFAIAGDSCDTAIPLPTLPFNDHLSTADYTSALNLSDPCIPHTSFGPDIIYRFTNPLPWPCTVSVMAVPLGFWNPVIYVLSDCETPICEEGNDLFGPGIPESLIVKLESGETYYFVIDGRSSSDYGVISFSFSECYNSVVVHEEQTELLPSSFDVIPNPTNGIVDFRFTVTQQEAIGLDIFDQTGRLIWNFDDAMWDAGNHVITWNILDNGGIKASPGIYFVKLRRKGIESVQKFVLVE